MTPNGPGHGAKLPRKQSDAIAALLSCGTVDRAARAAGVSARTLLRWMRLPEFRAEYQAARRQALEAAIGVVQAATSSAVGVLVEVMEDAHAPASTRIAAARMVIETSLRGVEALEYEERLSRLERALEDRQRGALRRWGA